MFTSRASRGETPPDPSNSSLRWNYVVRRPRLTFLSKAFVMKPRPPSSLRWGCHENPRFSTTSSKDHVAYQGCQEDPRGPHLPSSLETDMAVNLRALPGA